MLTRLKFLPAALLLTLCASLLHADPVPIRFDQIKPGTEFYYETIGPGPNWMERYEGRKGDQHIVRSYFTNGGQPESRFYFTRYYNAQGLLVRLVSHSTSTGSADLDKRFIPFDCTRAGPGKCAHKRAIIDSRTGKPASAYTKQFEIRKTGRTYLVIRNANTNRLKDRYTFDDRGILTERRAVTKDVTKGEKLVQEQRPK